MKSLLVILSLSSLMYAKSSFAGNTDINPVVTNAFNKTYNNVSDVKWSEANGFYKVEFDYKNQHITDYYNADGDLIASSQEVSSTSLPSSLQVTLKKYLADYWISDLYKITNEEGTTYYVSLKSADKQVVLRSVSDKKWVNFN
jgi:hypothetical protein